MTISVAQGQLFFLGLTRTLAILSSVPVLGSATIPARVRLAIGILIALVVAPLAEVASDEQALPLAGFAVSVGLEFMTGLLAGFVVRMAFAAVQMAANVMSTLAGFSAGQFLNPTLNIQGSALDQFYLVTMTTLFVVLNGHHQLIIGLKRTFDLVPLGAFVFDVASLDELLQLSVGMWLSALQIALPIAAAMFLIDLALGLISRAAPQIQVFFVGAPLKTGFGMLAVAAVISGLLPIVQALSRNTAAQMIGLLQ